MNIKKIKKLKISKKSEVLSFLISEFLLNGFYIRSCYIDGE